MQIKICYLIIKIPAIKIVQIAGNHDIQLDREKLESIVNQVEGYPYVCIVSVAGAFRTGKSFLLSFFVLFLKNRRFMEQNWMENEQNFSKNMYFNWDNGIETITEGIWLWSEPFVFRMENSEKLV